MRIDPFTLFAAYHLGLTPDGAYRFSNLHEVAHLLGVSPPALQQALADARLDADAVLDSGYDVASAQADVMCAASSDERRAIARRHWDAYRDAQGTPHHRDWARELAEDAAENERIFGKRE